MILKTNTPFGEEGWGCEATADQERESGDKVKGLWSESRWGKRRPTAKTLANYRGSKKAPERRRTRNDKGHRSPDHL